MSIEQKLADLKAKHSAALLKKAGMEALKESEQAKLQEYMRQLKDTFGVDNSTQARDKLAELQADLASKMDEIDSALKNIKF